MVFNELGIKCSTFNMTAEEAFQQRACNSTPAARNLKFEANFQF